MPKRYMGLAENNIMFARKNKESRLYKWLYRIRVEIFISNQQRVSCYYNKLKITSMLLRIAKNPNNTMATKLL